MFSKSKNPLNNTTFSVTPDKNILVYKTLSGLDKLATLGQATDISSVPAQAIIQSASSSVKLLNVSANSTDTSTLMTSQSLFRNALLGSHAPFVKTFIIRGIGYQADVVDNDLSGNREFPHSRYLSLRVGHSFHLYKPIPAYIGVKVSHKDRKLVIYGANKEQVSNYANVIFKLRPPSVYTGRGIRIKKGLHRRKLGKKDIRKGKV